MALPSEIIEDRRRLHAVVDAKGGRGLPWAVSLERKFLGAAFASVMLLKFAPEIAYWTVRVFQETGCSPFFDNGFDYCFEKNGRTMTKRYSKMKFTSLELGTIENERSARREGDSYQPIRAGDPRITSVGKVMRPKAHDESLQLFNILAGQLGVIGLRTGKLEFEFDILANKQQEPFKTYLEQLRLGVLPGFIPVHVTCPDTRKILLERRLHLETYYAQRVASFLNDCKIVSHFIRHRGEILK